MIEPIINPNQLAAETFVAALAAAGLRAVCIGPGSRSTPLTLACHRHPDVRTYLHVDERSAGFFALGMAMATARPVALLCTSGTAAAEFFPAIVEANLSQVPLLVLTADRPHELRHSGANQTVDQVKLYGDHVRWAVDMALPSADEPPVAQRNLHTMAARAYGIANGLRKGPVHLNFPFRKPLEPDEPQSAPFTPYRTPAVAIERGILAPTTAQISAMVTLFDQHLRGLIVCGPNCPGGDFPAAVAELAAVTGYPLVADPLSGVRFGPHTANAPLIAGYDSFLAGAAVRTSKTHPVPRSLQLVIRFGVVPTSKWLSAYLTAAAPEQYIHVRESGVWADDSHLVNCFMQVNEAGFCRRVAKDVAVSSPHIHEANKWTDAFLAAESASWRVIDDYLGAHFFDGAVVAEALDVMADALPAGANLVIGNSLPVRHLDQFARPRTAAIDVFGNRGASGIDGVTSTALGVAAGGDRPTVLITGDVSFVHDLNGLLAVNQHAIRNITIVLINNRGGGIFRRLPIAAHDPPFTELFLTPHDLQFAHAARFYGLTHQFATDRLTFRTLLTDALHGLSPTIIEVQTDGVSDLEHQRTVVQMVRGELARDA